MFTKKKIIFDTYLGEDADSFLNPPLPSKKVIPEWYKKIETLHNRDASQPSVKKCMPFLDALSMGYTISTGWDIHIKKYQKEGVWNLEVSYAPQVNEILTIKGLAIDSHSPNQFSEDGYNSDEEVTYGIGYNINDNFKVASELSGDGDTVIRASYSF